MSNSTMAYKMNSNTHKLITATLHPVEHHFAVPNDWDLEDITYESGILFYKGKKQYVPKVVDDGECKDLDELKEGIWMDLDVYFDCENFDLYKYEEEEEKGVYTKEEKWDKVCEFWNDRKNREGDFLDFMCDKLGFKLEWKED